MPYGCPTYLAYLSTILSRHCLSRFDEFEETGFAFWSSLVSSSSTSYKKLSSIHLLLALISHTVAVSSPFSYRHDRRECHFLQFYTYYLILCFTDFAIEFTPLHSYKPIISVLPPKCYMCNYYQTAHEYLVLQKYVLHHEEKWNSELFELMYLKLRIEALLSIYGIKEIIRCRFSNRYTYPIPPKLI